MGDDGVYSRGVHVTVTWDEQPIIVSSVGPLARVTDVVEHRDGGDPSTVHTSPGRTRFEPLVVERGITQDRRFEVWADLVSSADEAPPGAIRKDVEVKVFDDAGVAVAAFKVFRAWPSEYQALTRFDSRAATPPIEQLVLHHDGWIRLP